MTRTRTLLLRLAQVAVTAACLWYLLHDMRLAELADAMGAYSPWRLLLFTLLFLPFVLPAGMRLNYLTGGRATLPTALAAVFFGNGINNMLPAKLGEVAKAAYLARHGGIDAAQCLCVVFWERLADLNAVLICSVVLGLRFGVQQLYLPLLCGMAVIWCGMLLLFRFTGTFTRLAGRMPSARLRAFLRAMVERLGSARHRPRWTLLMGFSLGLWLLYSLYTLWFLSCVCGLSCGLWGAAFVCIAGGVGMILPSAPASLGAYEAGAVAALTLLGVDKAQALGAALALHLAQMIPFLFFAAWVLLREDFRFNAKETP